MSTDRPRFTMECLASVGAWIVSVLSHLTLHNISDVANVVIVVGMALTTTYAAISGTVKFAGVVRGWFSKKPPA